MKKPACPKCGSRRIVPIVRGMPTPEIEAARARGEVVLGGCMPWSTEELGPAPTHACRDCYHEFPVDAS
jgi:hypothetical protein